MKLGRMARLGRSVVKSYLWQTSPLEVGWDVTYRCNARCGYCSNWTTDYPVMPLDDCEKLISRMARVGAFQISLSGGEPMTRQDIVDVVRLIKKNGMRCSVVTNGSIYREDMFRGMMEAGINTITFSIDGATKETHEHFRFGTNFEKLIKSIQFCLETAKKEGFPTRISTNTVLTNANVDEIPRIAKLVTELGVKDYKFQPVWKQHFVPEHLKHTITDNFNDVYGFTKENEKLLDRAVELIAETGASNHPDYAAMIPDFYMGTEKATSMTCFAGRAFLFIDADGGVHPCGKVEESFGNILDDQWEADPGAMFESAEARQIKKDMAAQKCGGCASVCYMERNILLHSVKNPAKLAGIVAKRVLRPEKAEEPAPAAAATTAATS